MIINQLQSQNKIKYFSNLLLMVNDHNDCNHNEILQECWYTNTPTRSSASDSSGDTKDDLIDLTSVFISFVMEHTFVGL